MPTIKITETVRAEKLRRVDGRLVPSVTRDSEIAGLALHVMRGRSFWALHYQPRGINPATGKRWGGGVRYELGDGVGIPGADARAAALAAKALVRQGRDPLREAMASRAFAVAERAILPAATADVLAAYEKAVMARRTPSEATRKQTVTYARKAVRLMKAESLALSEIDARVVMLLVETMPGSSGERRHVFHGFDKFMRWGKRQRLIDHNPCDDLDRNERPKPGKARDNTPSLSLVRGIWAAVEDEPMRDLARTLLLIPLRLSEAAGLRWSEVALDSGRILIASHRMKNNQVHELPLSDPALAILAARKAANVRPTDLVFPSAAGKPYDGWNRLATRIRKRIGQAETAKQQAFSFHDIRRSFVSHLAGRFDVDLLDQCLSHTRKGVLGVYQRSSRWPERVAALNAWAAALLCGDAIPRQTTSSASPPADMSRLREPAGPPSAERVSVGSPYAVLAPSRPVGVLGMTHQERAELRRAKKWPQRRVATPEGPPGLSLSSLPSPEFLRGYVAALRQPRRRGRSSERANHIALAIECLKETGDRTEEARKEYVKRSPYVQSDTASRQFSGALKIIQALSEGD
jgi:integrase